MFCPDIVQFSEEKKIKEYRIFSQTTAVNRILLDTKPNSQMITKRTKRILLDIRLRGAPFDIQGGGIEVFLRRKTSPT